jgi:hypothetical protein
LANTIRVVGYTIKPSAIAPGEEAILEVAWESLEGLEREVSLFAHLVDGQGTIYGQDDQVVVAEDGISLTHFRLTPRLSMATGPATVMIGVAGFQDAPADSVVAVEREMVTQIEIVPGDMMPITLNESYRPIDDQPSEILVGYDWDTTLPGKERLYLHWTGESGSYRNEVIDGPDLDMTGLPPYRGPWGVLFQNWQFPAGRNSGHYIPFGQGIVWTGQPLPGSSPRAGETVILRQLLHSAWPLNRDYVVSVRLIGLEPDGVHWAWWDLQDSIPAMGAIPTLKWIEGSQVRSPHRLTVSTSATPGQSLTGALTLYDAFTNRRIPILDERITAKYAWVPIGEDSVGD